MRPKKENSKDLFSRSLDSNQASVSSYTDSIRKIRNDKLAFYAATILKRISKSPVKVPRSFKEHLKINISQYRIIYMDWQISKQKNEGDKDYGAFQFARNFLRESLEELIVEYSKKLDDYNMEQAAISYTAKKNKV